ncbi:MAG: hypothetical protein O7B35_01075 [Deltaproteobacteria bacterium]|nr:hypothetical protein [Deltaproteobacteria bacterium]
MPTSTCYMCDSPETSRKHAPPLCFFPEAKEVGRDLRRNLITVPSCERHNSRKSKDDEYFRSVILMTVAPNSDTGRHQFNRKLLRAADRTPHAHRLFFADKGTIAEGKERVLQIDRERFDACIDHLARALFFDAFHRKWSLPISVYSPNFFSGIDSDQVVPHQLTQDTVEVSRQVLGPEPIRGENPEVFKYRLRYDKTDETYNFWAMFYDYFEIYSFSSKH